MRTVTYLATGMIAVASLGGCETVRRRPRRQRRTAAACVATPRPMQASGVSGGARPFLTDIACALSTVLEAPTLCPQSP